MTVAMKLKDACSLEKKLWQTNLDSIVKSRDITLPTKFHLVKAIVFPVVMYGCESWTIRRLSAKGLMLLNCGVGEDFWDLHYKEMKPVNPKENQSWMFIGRTDAEAEVPILWPPDAKSRLIGKDSDAEKDRRQEKGVTEDEMVGWHPWLKGHEFEQSSGNAEGQGSPVCCSPGGLKESDMTEQLGIINNTLLQESRSLQVLGHQDLPLAHSWQHCFCNMSASPAVPNTQFKICYIGGNQ